MMSAFFHFQKNGPPRPQKKTTLTNPSAIRVKGYFQSNSTAFKSNRFVTDITKNVLSFYTTFFFHMKALKLSI